MSSSAAIPKGAPCKCISISNRNTKKNSWISLWNSGWISEENNGYIKAGNAGRMPSKALEGIPEKKILKEFIENPYKNHRTIFWDILGKTSRGVSRKTLRKATEVTSAQIPAGILGGVPEESLSETCGEIRRQFFVIIHGEVPSEETRKKSKELQPKFLEYLRAHFWAIHREITGGFITRVFGNVPGGINEEILGEIPL